MKCLIYLADLQHCSPTGIRQYSIPLNIGFIGAYAKQQLGDSIDVQLFKNPEILIEAIRRKPPHILGLSSYMWNDHLGLQIAQFAKSVHAKTLITLGGPNISSDESKALSLLRANPQIDFLIYNEGEQPFCEIVTKFLSNPKGLKSSPIGYCFQLNHQELIKGEMLTPCTSDINQFPSPYLTGLLDPFLKESCMPLLETVRGCPFTCAYCVAGHFTNRIRKFDLARVFEEIRYIQKRASNSYLDIVDLNFGLYARDLEIAQFLRAEYDRSKFPFPFHCYYTKKITPWLHDIVTLMNPLHGHGFNISLQSTHPQVLQFIVRSNTPENEFLQNVKWGRTHNLSTSTELIFGFPHETRESYLKSLRLVLNSGVRNCITYNLLILKGSDLDNEVMRKRYQIQTRFRLMDKAYGTYSELQALEVEEVVVSTLSSTMDDYFFVRKINLFIHMFSILGFYAEVFHHCSTYGLDMLDIIIRIVDKDKTAFPLTEQVFKQYEESARLELHNTPEEARRKLLDSSTERDSSASFLLAKLNNLFTAKFLFSDSRQNFNIYLKQSILDCYLAKYKTASSTFITELDTVVSMCDAAIIDPRHTERTFFVQEIGYDFCSWRVDPAASRLTRWARNNLIGEFSIPDIEMLNKFHNVSSHLPLDAYYHNYLSEIIPYSNMHYHLACKEV